MLNNESAAYVAGWYKEISSLRNYKGADENGDSYIDDNEALNLKGFFHFKEFLIHSDNPYATYVFDLKKYQSLSKLDNDLLMQVKDFFVEESINLALDKSLLLDMDLDGKILYKEAFSLRDLRNVSALLVNDAIGKELFQTSDMNEYFEHIRKFKEKMAKEVATKAEEEVKLVSDNDEEEKNKIRSKLLANGLSALSVEERELARKYFPNLIKDTQDSKGIDSLVKDLQALDENLTSFDLILKNTTKTIKINLKKPI